MVRPSLSGSRSSAAAGLPPHRTKLTSAGRPVVAWWHGSDIIRCGGVMEEVRGGRGLQRHIGVGGFSGWLEVQIHILVWDSPGGPGFQTEGLLERRTVTPRSRSRFETGNTDGFNPDEQRRDWFTGYLCGSGSVSASVHELLRPAGELVQEEVETKHRAHRDGTCW